MLDLTDEEKANDWFDGFFLTIAGDGSVKLWPGLWRFMLFISLIMSGAFVLITGVIWSFAT